MRKRTFGLALIAAVSIGTPCFAGPVITPGEAPGAPLGSGIFGAVSAAEGAHLQNILAAPGIDLGGVSNSLAANLRGIDITVPEQRSLLAPLNQALKDIRAKGLSEGAVVPEALRLIDDRMKTLTSAAESPDAGEAELAQSASELERMRAFVAFYRPENVDALTRASSQADARLRELRAARTEEAIRRTEESLVRSKAAGDAIPGGEAGESGWNASADDGQVAVAEGLVDELQRAEDIAYSESLVKRLRAMAEASSKESVQRIIARGLAADLEEAYDASYACHLVAALKSISLKTSFDNVREIAIQGIMDGIFAAFDRSYREAALNAVEEIASESPSKRLKGMAIALLLREMRNSNDAGYCKLIQEKIDAVAKTGDGLENIPVPIITDPPRGDRDVVLAISNIAGVALFLILFKIAPPIGDPFTQAARTIGLVALANYVFVPLRNDRIYALAFVAVAGAIVTLAFLAPAYFFKGAATTVSIVYFVLLLLNL